MEPASNPSPAEVPASKVDPNRWVDEHGDCLYRYALVRVRTPEVAEDLVQETLFSRGPLEAFGKADASAPVAANLEGPLI